MFKAILTLFLFAISLQAATLTSQKPTYTVGQTLSFTFTELSKDKDWIGIYAAGANNDWGNVLAWKWTGDRVDGSTEFTTLPAGNYEARVFLHNSFQTAATAPFNIIEAPHNSTISTKDSYQLEEEIVVTLGNAAGNNNDWVGIYPVGADNEWKNVVAWKFTNGLVNGELNLGKVAAGQYEARLFFNNAYTVEASHAFTVNGVVHNATISTSKESYQENESVTVTLGNTPGNKNDWVGIYPVGSNNDWGNVVAWTYTNGIVNGNLDLGKIPKGTYEARLFFNNTFNKEASSNFSVVAINLPPTLYEDAENGLANWTTVLGNSQARRHTPGFQSQGNVAFSAHWVQLDNGYWSNRAEYHLTMNNTTQKILSVDKAYGKGGAGGHFAFGVRVTTTQGVRRVVWTHTNNHYHIKDNIRHYGDVGFITLGEPNLVGNTRKFTDGTSENEWYHHNIDIEETIRRFEPDNTLISVDYFFTTGGAFDNITLK